jgi:hypothetical protein
MLTTIEAEVDANGNIRPTEEVTLPPGSRVLITVLSAPEVSETALLSEAALATDWNRPEEDAAWSYLSQV